jgi:hypothetical protein
MPQFCGTHAHRTIPTIALASIDCRASAHQIEASTASLPRQHNPNQQGNSDVVWVSIPRQAFFEFALAVSAG